MKKSFPIQGVWQLLLGRAAGEKATSSVPAQIPGNVAWDLHEAGLLPDPYVAENFRACAWAEEESFTYRTQLTIPAFCLSADQIFLEFPGLDTFGEVFFDGVSLGKTSNMFRCHRFRLPQALCEKEIVELEVRIDPPIPGARDWIESNQIDLSKTEAAFAVPERVATRKMQMSYGWDNCPHLLSGGIFRQPQIVSYHGACLEDYQWRVLELAEDHSQVTVEFLMETRSCPDGHDLYVSGTLRDSRFEGKGRVHGDKARVMVSISSPYLWWPHGHGAPDQYEVSFCLRDSAGKLEDSFETEIGLRTVELDRSVSGKLQIDYKLGAVPAEEMDGGFIPAWSRVGLEKAEEVEIHNFVLKVNHTPIPIRGANWQTPDIFPGLITDQTYRRHCRLAHAANLNLLRLWGGGIHEAPAFYEECSRLGLLVWQDFHFACGLYPREEAFLQMIREEVPDIIRQLRRHTCLAVWCGDNEHDMVEFDRGKDPALNPVNKKIIPQAIAEHDWQARPYHPSSPSGGPYPRSEWAGDRRDWGAWYPHRDYQHIREDQARFVSEGGSYALPSKAVIEEAIPEAMRWPLSSRTWCLHGGDVDREARNFSSINQGCWEFFGDLRGWEEAVELTQFAQAWGYKRLVEHQRRRFPECGGVVLWKLNDCWPACDAGLIDWREQPRISWEFVRQAYEPLAVSVESSLPDEDKLAVRFWVINDTPEMIEGQLHWEYVEVDKTSGNRPSTTAGGKCVVVCPPGKSLAIEELGRMPSEDVVVRLSLSVTDRCDVQTWFCLSPKKALAYYRQRTEMEGTGPRRDLVEEDLVTSERS